MDRCILSLIFACWALALSALSNFAAAQPEDRVALVIGNAHYRYLPRLENPDNDARLIAATLQSLGFRLIGGAAQIDLDRSGFARAIREFGGALGSSSVGVFYYAGHGVQLQGVNFLVPVSADPTTAADADLEMIDANTVLKEMEAAGSKLNIVILDACRNNPFGGRGLRDAGGGLAQMQAPRGSLIFYATQPGNVAIDGDTGHSPYTVALAEAIKKPGIPVLEVFNQVGLAVDRATGGRQQPWMAISPLQGTFYFLGPTTAKTPPASPDPETIFWQTIAQGNNAADYEKYLRQFPQGLFAGLARARIARLRAPTPTVPGSRGPVGTFDGVWLTTEVCPGVPTRQENGRTFTEVTGYSKVFAAQINNGAFHGENGAKGQPGWLLLEGGVNPDGTMHLIGKGITGGNAATNFYHHSRPGPYQFIVNAHLGSSAGTGKRASDPRECGFSFVKQ
jgi:hypothetical protein